MSCRFTLALSIFLCMCPIPKRISLGAEPHTDLPRYHFSVGEEFAYREISKEIPLPDEKPDKERSERTGEWRICVARQNDDGSFRLLIQRNIRLAHIKRGEEPKEAISNRMLAYCDMFPDGRILPNDTLGDALYFAINPSWLFIPLPADPKELKTGWTGSAAVGEMKLECSVGEVSTPDRSISIECAIRQPSQPIYGEKETRHCNFDVTSGRLTEFEQESTGNYSLARWHTLNSVTLESVTLQPLESLKHYQLEAEQLFQSNRDYQNELLEARRTRTKADCELHLAAARDKLKQARSAATLQTVQEQYEALLTVHDREAKWNIQYAESREQVYSSNPADWELSDLEGMSHQLKDYRGKVVVLDFWYRGCGWCVKAMPQIKELSEKYIGKDVVIFGMNLDENEEDAQVVIRELGIPYKNLKAKEVVKLYQARALGYPVLYILDQEGRVRDIHEGYRPDLGVIVSDTIDKLLKNPPQAN